MSDNPKNIFFGGSKHWTTVGFEVDAGTREIEVPIEPRYAMPIEIDLQPENISHLKIQVEVYKRDPLTPNIFAYSHIKQL